MKVPGNDVDKMPFRDLRWILGFCLRFRDFACDFGTLIRIFGILILLAILSKKDCREVYLVLLVVWDRGVGYSSEGPFAAQ